MDGETKSNIGKSIILLGFLGIIICLLFYFLKYPWTTIEKYDNIVVFFWIFFIFLSLAGFGIYYYKNRKDEIFSIIWKYFIFLLFIIITIMINWVLFSGISYKLWLIGLIIVSSIILFYTIEGGFTSKPLQS